MNGKGGIILKQLLVTFMVFSLFSTAFALQAPENNTKQLDLISIISKIEPFMKLNSDKTVRFDVVAARKVLDDRSFEIGKIYERFHNSTMNAINTNQKPFQTLQDKEDLKLFEPFFLAVQRTGALTTKELINSMQASSVPAIATKEYLHSKKPIILNFSAKKKIQTISFACNGGGPLAPAYCPAWQFPTNQYSNSTAAGNVLIQMGYHNTYFPGCGWDYPCSSDFTKWLTVNGCNYGVFRSQAIPYKVGTIWKVKFQSPEPNPEINSYTWPAAVWWGPYVVYWHQVWPQPNGKLGC